MTAAFAGGCDSFVWLFMIADKARARGEDVKGVGVVRDKELKLEDGEGSLAHSRWSGGRGYPRRGN